MYQVERENINTVTIENPKKKSSIKIAYIGPIDNIKELYKSAGIIEEKILEEESDIPNNDTYITTINENKESNNYNKELLKASQSLGANYFGIAVGTITLGLGFLSPFLKGFEKDIVTIIGSGVLSYNLVRATKNSMMIKGLTNNNSISDKLEESEHVKRLVRNK